MDARKCCAGGWRTEAETRGTERAVLEPSVVTSPNSGPHTHANVMRQVVRQQSFQLHAAAGAFSGENLCNHPELAKL